MLREKRLPVPSVEFVDPLKKQIAKVSNSQILSEEEKQFRKAEELRLTMLVENMKQARSIYT